MVMKYFLILILIPVFLNSQLSFAQNVPAHDSVRTEKFENGVISAEHLFLHGELIQSRFFDTEARFKSWYRYEHPTQENIIITEISTDSDSFGQIFKKKEWTHLNAQRQVTPDSVLVKEWHYSKSIPTTFQYLARFEIQKPFRIIQKDYFNSEGLLTSSLNFEYEGDQIKPTAFIEKNPLSQILSQFSLYEKYSPAETLKNRGYSNSEIQRLIQKQNEPGKFLIAIIDSGFDYNHEALITKWWNNPSDPRDGIDNDHNGWVDDNFGWDQVQDVGLPTESSTDLTEDIRPLSHGTHVADLAIHDLEGAALIGFAGDYTQADYLKKISAFIKKHQVKIINLSLGFPGDLKDRFGLNQGIRALSEMIEQNPDSLFVVAAGNEESNLDEYKNRQYPASFNFPNLLKVGALNASQFSQLNPETAQMVSFSNYGLKSVDVLAPGVKLSAASLGGGLIEYDGTSGSSPIAVNLAARLWMAYPQLKAVQVRSLLIESAQKTSPPSPVLSGGYLDLAAALQKAKILFH
jgi:hypothetical protein